MRDLTIVSPLSCTNEVRYTSSMVREEAYERGVAEGMAKFAISRFRQYVRSQFGPNRPNPASLDLVNKAYPPRVLGSGLEGTATQMMVPQALEGGKLTPTVRKVFPDSAPFASPTLVQRRIAMGPELNKDPSFAKFYGSGRNAANQQYIDSEYIPYRATGAPLAPIQAKVDRGVRSAGMRLGLGHLTAKDVRMDNLGRRRPDGPPVSFDYLPFKRDEIYDNRYVAASGLPSHAAIEKPGVASRLLLNTTPDNYVTPSQAQTRHESMNQLLAAHQQSKRPLTLGRVDADAPTGFVPPPVSRPSDGRAAESVPAAG